MKKILLLLVITIGLVNIYSNYNLAEEKAAAAAVAELEQAALLDAELAAFEAELIAKLELQEIQDRDGKTSCP